MDDWNDFLEAEEQETQKETRMSNAPIPPVGTARSPIFPESTAETVPQTASSKDKHSFLLKSLLTGLSLQIILCLCVVIVMILLNTFLPRYYSAIDYSLKAELTRTVSMKKDAQQVMGRVSSFLDEIRPNTPDTSEDTPNSSQPSSEKEETSSPNSEDGKASDTSEAASSDSASASTGTE